MNPDLYVVLHFTPSEGVKVLGPYDSESKARGVRDARFSNHPTAVVKCEPAWEDE